MARSIPEYREQKLKQEASIQKLRECCKTCLRPHTACYCAQVTRFDAKIKFAILIHPMERKRHIATGRMAYASLENASLIEGEDYSENRRVNELIANPDHHCVILFPGTQAVNLSELNPEGRAALFPKEKKLVVFVIDGTWNTAKKTMFWSENLKKLSRICFVPPAPSRFRIRTQPTAECYSTVEAIHQTIELIGEAQGYSVESRAHDFLLKPFDWMVETQLSSYLPSEPNIRRVRATRHLHSLPNRR